LPPSSLSDRRSSTDSEAAPKSESVIFNLGRTLSKRVAASRSAQAIERLKRLAQEKSEAATGKEVDSGIVVDSPDGGNTPTRLSWAEKGKEVQRNSQDDVVDVGIAGVHKSPLEWSQFFLRARDALPKRRSVCLLDLFFSV
jgi:hypothetical protein